MAVGLEFEATSSRVFYGFPGSRIDTYFDGAYQSTTLWAGDDIRTRNRRTTFYAQDRWSVGRGVTLEPGVRVESYGGRPRQGGDVFSTTPVALRLGAAWDPTASHRTVVRAHYGRYHDMLFSQIYSWHDSVGLNNRVTGVMHRHGAVRAAIGIERCDPRVSDRPGSETVARRPGVDRRRTPALARCRGGGAIRRRAASRTSSGTSISVSTSGRRSSRRTPGLDGRLGTTDDGAMLTGFVPYWWPTGDRDLVITNPEGADAPVRRRAGDCPQAAGRQLGGPGVVHVVADERHHPRPGVHVGHLLEPVAAGFGGSPAGRSRSAPRRSRGHSSTTTS